MKKKRYLIIILCFTILTLIESGIFIEIIAHCLRAPMDSPPLKYNEAGQNGVSVLLLFIPVCVLITLLIRIVLCLKQRSGVKNLLLDCIYALLGVGIGFGLFFLADLFNAFLEYNPFFSLGKRITAFVIDQHNWLEKDLPIP